MKNTQPLLIVLGIFLVLILLTYNMKENNNTLDNSILKLNNIQSIGDDFRYITKNWFDEKSINKRITAIINDRHFKKNKIDKKVVKNAIKLSLTTSDKKILGIFISKVMNEKFEITQYNFTDNSASFEIGVK